jgi:hypothetical protein
MPLSLALPPPDPGVEIALSSQGMSQGIAQTEGFQLFPRIFMRMGAAQLGAQWRNVSSPSANGVAAFFVKYGRRVGTAQLEFAAAYRVRTGARGPGHPTAWEFSGTARQSLGRWVLRASADYSPDEFGNGSALYAELGPTFNIDKATRISGGIGRKSRERGPDYTAFNLGVSRSVGQKVTLDARYHDTNRSGLSARYGARIVVSASLSF